MKTNETKLVSLLKILSDENKLKIILHLMKGEECVCNLAEKVGVERTLVSHHLKTLRDVGLINDRKLGNWVHCSLDRDVFSKLSELFSKILSPENISDKMCSLHEGCKCLSKGDLNE